MTPKSRRSRKSFPDPRGADVCGAVDTVPVRNLPVIDDEDADLARFTGLFRSDQ
jgi:hypothetical protein